VLQGGHDPRGTDDWFILAITAAFAIFMCSFILLFGLSLFVGLIAVLQQIVGF
jgi:hypothetical protein